MTDEEKRVVEKLNGWRVPASELSFSDIAEMKNDTLVAADLIERLYVRLDQAVTENEHIRQTHVTHEVYQQILAELEQVKRERDAAVYDLTSYHGDCKTCRHMADTSESACRACSNGKDNNWTWRGPCAENGGTEDADLAPD